MNAEEIEVVMEGLDIDDIQSVLKKWNEVVTIRRKLTEFEDTLKARVKSYMKERKWDSYKEPNTDIHVSISMMKRETLDKTKVRMVLTEAQMAQVTKVTSYEKMNITSKEDRKRLGKYVRQVKK